MPVRQRLKELQTRITERLFGRFASFAKDQRGAVFVYVAVSLPVIIGFAGLGVDISMWQLQKRRAQGMADAGAMHAAVSVMRTGGFTTITAAATEGATDNAFSAAAGDVIEVNNPPLNGVSAGDDDVIEVMVTTPAPTFFSAMLSDTQRTVSARAATRVVDEPGDLCMMSLDPDGGITVGGTSTVSLDCAALSNGDVTINGGGCLTATQVKYVDTGDDNDCSTDPTRTFTRPDPLRFLAEPVFGACDKNSNTVVTNGETEEFWAPSDDGIFVFCRDITVNNGGTLILNQGVYVLHGAGINISGDFIARGVTIFLSDLVTVNDNVTINGQASVDHRAPEPGDMDGANKCWTNVAAQTRGDCSVLARTVDDPFPDGYEGIAYFESRNSAAGVNHVFAGGADMNIDGIVYMANADVAWEGGSVSDVKAVLAANITVQGNSTFTTIEGTILEDLLAFTFVKMAE